MAENIKVDVEPTPIQRNKRDVAMELLEIYLRGDRERVRCTEDKLIEVYNKFYANAAIIESKRLENLQEYL